METGDRAAARRLLSVVSTEARRIETRFSRYLAGNPVHAINHAGGRPVEVDEETARLLEFADQLHKLSGGKFDITSGVLRRVWKFDGSDRLPNPEAVDEVRKLIGWHRVEWDGRHIRLEPGMEIDFGGVGKEYAVDRAARLASEASSCSSLINFGGDIVVTRPRKHMEPWRVGLENPERSVPTAARLLDLTAGGMATSGDARRFLIRDGVLYGHILDPTTGWPVAGGPRSVTVAAGTCVQAGMLATLAMLEGSGARAFLEEQGVTFWIVA